MKFESRLLPLPNNNIDTDQIIPARVLKTTSKEGLDQQLFYDWRYDERGNPKPDFILNQPRAKGAAVLLAGDNFGCGSSREHAPMAIKAAGIQAVIARSFARIFYRNAINIGLPVIQCDAIYDAVKDGDSVSIDIRSGGVDANGKMFQGETPGPVAVAIMEAGTLIDLIKTRGWAAIEEVS